MLYLAETKIHLLIQSWKCDQPVTPSLCQEHRFLIRSLHATLNRSPTQLRSHLQILVSDSRDCPSRKHLAAAQPACVAAEWKRFHRTEFPHLKRFCYYNYFWRNLYHNFNPLELTIPCMPRCDIITRTWALLKTDPLPLRVKVC